MHIYAYAGLLEQLPYFNDSSLQFLKNNFNKFAIYLPESDVAYYRGVIERGASVHLYAYVDEKMKRDVSNLEKYEIVSDVSKFSTITPEIVLFSIIKSFV